ncbi:MAG: hypothetical protein R2772_05890 [Chitinophagales bacterium]
MNAAALKDSLKSLKKTGLLIVDIAGFDKKNLRLAAFDPEEDLLEESRFSDYHFIKIDISSLSKEALKEIDLDPIKG